MEKNIRQLQEQIIQSYNEIYGYIPLKANVINSFYNTPRHKYVEKYRYIGSNIWNDINLKDLNKDLNVIYRDGFLITDGDDDDHIISSLSQPSIVLLMLNILPLRIGDRVLEIGAGSGWNAVMLGRLVGPQGRVNTVEIDPVVFERARRNVATSDIDNVQVINGDGASGDQQEGKYDVVVFTVGSYDITPEIANSVKNQGFLLMILKTNGGGDILFLLKKNGEVFESCFSLPCGFVQMQGRLRFEELEPVYYQDVPTLLSLVKSATNTRDFWFGENNSVGFLWRSAAFRSYLSAICPEYFVFSLKRGIEINSNQICFGIYFEKENSICFFHDQKMISAGGNNAEQALIDILNRWLAAGMPSLSCYSMIAQPSNTNKSTVREYEIVIKRRFYQFYFK